MPYTYVRHTCVMMCIFGASEIFFVYESVAIIPLLSSIQPNYVECSLQCNAMFEPMQLLDWVYMSS